MTYYRFSNNGAMSAWGHAMFSSDEDAVEMYGDTEYTYNGNEAVEIEALRDMIITKWNESLENGMEPIGYEDVTAEDIYNEFNPDDIVMSAQAWDNSDLLTWFCENIAIENEIKAVITNDGAIVFDINLIEEV